MDAEYNDYVNDVCSFLEARRLDAKHLLEDPKTVASLWRATVDGWNHGKPAAQVIIDWCRGSKEIPDPVVASREIRRQIWEAARI